MLQIPNKMVTTLSWKIGLLVLVSNQEKMHFLRNGCLHPHRRTVVHYE
jgi:hypothetical protein